MAVKKKAPQKKVAEPKKEVAAKAEPAVEAKPPEPTAEQQAAIDAVFEKKQAEIKAEVATILGGNAVAGLGTPSKNQEETQERVQRDRLPGVRRLDKTYVPESIEDERGNYRKVLRYSEYRYCMIPQEDFLTYRMKGWRHCMYDGGSRSGLNGEGWQHTGDTVFERDIRGYCRRGDVFLMYIPVRGWEELKAEDKQAVERSMKGPIGEFMNTTYHKGIRGFAEVDGESIV